MSTEIILIILFLFLFKDNSKSNHNPFYTGGVTYKPKQQKPKSPEEVRKKIRHK